MAKAPYSARHRRCRTGCRSSHGDPLDSPGRALRISGDGPAELQPARSELDARRPGGSHHELGRPRRRVDGRHHPAAVRPVGLLADRAARAAHRRQLSSHHAPRGGLGRTRAADRLAHRNPRVRARRAGVRRHRGAAHVVAEGAVAARAGRRRRRGRRGCDVACVRLHGRHAVAADRARDRPVAVFPLLVAVGRRACRRRDPVRRQRREAAPRGRARPQARRGRGRASRRQGRRARAHRGSRP